ncbi:MAG TPA: nucleotidyltransferase [Candidatus Desulfofervidus auxilii]|uniref:Nucleotidyltransferase n=1 Tax=Desulfofervidus auxilii TaxID=1621989 RepID=A0A7C0U2G9_DESA2|nr:nucleotidyltransferase [Candidatus Desulfofervidus auxilii]
MKSLEEVKRIINIYRKELEEKFKVKNIAIFGSYARGEQTPQSDIDIIVEFKEPVGMLFIHLADFLEEILGIKVDLLTPEAIKKNRIKYINEELIYV